MFSPACDVQPQFLPKCEKYQKHKTSTSSFHFLAKQMMIHFWTSRRLRLLCVVMVLYRTKKERALRYQARRGETMYNRIKKEWDRYPEPAQEVNRRVSYQRSEKGNSIEWFAFFCVFLNGVFPFAFYNRWESKQHRPAFKQTVEESNSDGEIL